MGKKFVPTKLECTECGTKTTIQRKRHKLKEYGHEKHMYCFKCKKTTLHKELKEEIYKCIL